MAVAFDLRASARACGCDPRARYTCEHFPQCEYGTERPSTCPACAQHTVWSPTPIVGMLHTTCRCGRSFMLTEHP